LAIQWELRRIGLSDIPRSWTIERVLARAGVTRPRRRQAGYVSRQVPYPALVVRFIRSNRRVDLFGKRISVAEDQTHQYVTAIIEVRAKKAIVVTSTARSSTTAATTCPGFSDDRNDALQAPHLHQRNDVLPAHRPPTKRNDVLPAKT
jgi:hypothetical protein